MSFAGCHHTEEVKNKMRGNTYGIGNRSNRGRCFSPEHRAKISKAMKGHPVSDKILTPEFRARLAEAQLKSARAMRGCPLSPEHRAKISASQKGRKFSARTRALMAAGRAAYLARWPKPATPLELGLYYLLSAAGLVFERQRRFGRYVVDAFVPSHALVFEADSTYWHQDKEREHRRDGYLIKRGISAIVHLGERDLAPWIVLARRGANGGV